MDRPGASVRCDDASTWRYRGERIDPQKLAALVSANGGAKNLDLHGADLTEIDLRPEALRKTAAVTPDLSWWATIGWVVLEGVHLEEASLIGAHLEGANLGGAHVERADLSAAHLERVDLGDAHLEGAYLIGTHLEGARLTSAHLEGAHLQSTHLQGSRLSSVYLEGADFKGARLEGARLNGAHLRDVDLYDAGSLVHVSWYGAFIDRTRMRSNQLGGKIGDELWAHDMKTTAAYRIASEAYLLLKNNFSSVGRYEDAAWAYLKEQQMEKMAYHWNWRWRFWRAWPSFLRWLRSWAYELLTGYGERVHMPVTWAVVVVLLFALIYAAAGNIATGDVGALEGQPTHSPVTALIHSISAFATIGFNTLEPQGWGARLLTAIEAMLGIGLFALFVFTLGNRMRRS